MELLRALYIRSRFFTVLITVIFLFVFGFIWPFVFRVALGLLVLLAFLLVIDILRLFRIPNPVFARRECTEKFSNGDENPVDIYLENRYPQTMNFEIIDEIPFQFQKRDVLFKTSLQPSGHHWIRYTLRPVKRGGYDFGRINIFAFTDLGFVSRRMRFEKEREVKVYPSFMQMRKYELLAISDRLTTAGIKKIRRIGNNKEFEQIETYVAGDDYRRINWKATACKNTLMVNHYQDERSQQVYSVIDKGRAMKMPFEGMTLLDYAINASLVISNIAIRKGDRAGLITLQEKINTIVPASGRNSQMRMITEALYRQKTSFKESSYAQLYTAIRRRLSQRSLIILYTNFESVHSMRRQLPYLRMINRRHLLLCIIFENTEVARLTSEEARNIEEVYTKGIAEQLMYEKQVIVREMQTHGMQVVLTAPSDLNINTINKYLELKARGLI